MYSEYRDDVEFLFPFAYLQYLSRYTIHVDRYLKTHLLIFFKEKAVFKVCVCELFWGGFFLWFFLTNMWL